MCIFLIAFFVSFNVVLILELKPETFFDRGTVCRCRKSIVIIDPEKFLNFSEVALKVMTF